MTALPVRTGNLAITLDKHSAAILIAGSSCSFAQCAPAVIAKNPNNIVSNAAQDSISTGDFLVRGVLVVAGLFTTSGDGENVADCRLTLGGVVNSIPDSFPLPASFVLLLRVVSKVKLICPA